MFIVIHKTFNPILINNNNIYLDSFTVNQVHLLQMSTQSEVKAIKNKYYYYVLYLFFKIYFINIII